MHLPLRGAWEGSLAVGTLARGHHCRQGTSRNWVVCTEKSRFLFHFHFLQRQGITHNLKYKCGYEGKFKRTWDLEMVYKCDECDYEGKSKMNLKAHVKQKHIRIRYSCGECYYQGSARGNLTVHVEIIQFGIKYKCDICDYQGGYKK